MELRPYQEKILEDCREAMRQGIKKMLVCLPTGGGKTAISTQIIHNANKKGLKSIFLVHRVELIEQTALTFKKFGLEFGIIAAGYEDTENDNLLIQIASIQTVYRRKKSLSHNPFDIVIIDECVHIASQSWLDVINLWPNAYRIGLTATPSRLSGEGFTNVFDKLILGPTVSNLIEQDYLASFKLYGPQVASFDKVHIKKGDYDTTEVEQIVNNKAITGEVIAHYQRLAHNKPAVVFCASVAHSKAVAEQFNNAGYKAVHIDGKTPKKDRLQVMEEFRSGKIKILTNCNLFVEGVDVPSLEVCILLRPTKSLALYLQAVGRALRYQEGKTAIIIDHTGNCQTHGLPDEVHHWTLEGRDVKKGKDNGEVVPIKICKKCYGVYKPHLQSCPYCGSVVAKEIKSPKQIAGELQEIKKIERHSEIKEEARARTFIELYVLGKKRGYKNPSGWAYHKMKARGSM
jgi:superfamily II DNA or RNA helicase